MNIDLVYKAKNSEEFVLRQVGMEAEDLALLRRSVGIKLIDRAPQISAYRTRKLPVVGTPDVLEFYQIEKPLSFNTALRGLRASQRNKPCWLNADAVMRNLLDCEWWIIVRGQAGEGTTLKAKENVRARVADREWMEEMTPRVQSLPVLTPSRQTDFEARNAFFSDEEKFLGAEEEDFDIELEELVVPDVRSPSLDSVGMLLAQIFGDIFEDDVVEEIMLAAM